MKFDQIVDRRGTRSLQWDAAEAVTGVAGDDALAMWLADTDFPMAEVIANALHRLTESGFVSYMSDITPFREATVWWMRERHGWTISPDWILPVNGLGNGISMLVTGLADLGDEVIVFSPVYQEFKMRIEAAGRRAVEIPMTCQDGRRIPDLERAAAAVTDRTKIVLFCSPHNPGGQVWTPEELGAVAEFARAHDLLLASDEIHQDIVYPGARFTPMAQIDGVADRLVTLAAPSKTFNIAGLRTGQLIIEDRALRDRMRATLEAAGVQPNIAGVTAAAAAYSPEGAAWADAQNAYLLGNRDRFAEGLNRIPGVRATPLEATFLAWVDFTGTGMSEAELKKRIIGRARIAAGHGSKFGPGGEGFFRFCIGTQRARIDEAVARLQDAFSDLQ